MYREVSYFLLSLKQLKGFPLMPAVLTRKGLFSVPAAALEKAKLLLSFQ